MQAEVKMKITRLTPGSYETLWIVAKERSRRSNAYIHTRIYEEAHITERKSNLDCSRADIAAISWQYLFKSRLLSPILDGNCDEK